MAGDSMAQHMRHLNEQIRVATSVIESLMKTGRDAVDSVRHRALEMAIDASRSHDGWTPEMLVAAAGQFETYLRGAPSGECQHVSFTRHGHAELCDGCGVSKMRLTDPQIDDRDEVRNINSRAGIYKQDRIQGATIAEAIAFLTATAKVHGDDALLVVVSPNLSEGFPGYVSITPVPR